MNRTYVRGAGEWRGERLGALLAETDQTACLRGHSRNPALRLHEGAGGRRTRCSRRDFIREWGGRQPSLSALVGTVIVICIFFLSCQNPFSPATADPSGTKPIVRQTEPGAVLHNFRYAYEHNDIDVYEKCLDPGFTFRYTDQNLAGEIEVVDIPRDGPSGDLERTRKLFRFFDEIRLESWKPMPDSPEVVDGEKWEVYRVYFQLSVRDLDGDFGGEAFEAFGIAVFKFRQSSSDRLWRIVFWEDRSVI